MKNNAVKTCCKDSFVENMVSLALEGEGGRKPGEGGNKYNAKSGTVYRNPLIPALRTFPLMGKGIRSGFTLIELLVMVLIIGILAAVALPQYNKAVKKAQGREVLVALNALDKALADYYLEHGSFREECLSAEDLNVQMPKLKYFKYKSHVNQQQTSEFERECISSGVDLMSIELVGPEGMQIVALWSPRSYLVLCYAGGNRVTCSQYFDCPPGPLQGSSAELASYQCRLK